MQVKQSPLRHLSTIMNPKEYQQRKQLQAPKKPKIRLKKPKYNMRTISLEK